MLLLVEKIQKSCTKQPNNIMLCKVTIYKQCQISGSQDQCYRKRETIKDTK
jgi:hypothetical protein